jgi:hypothetical protein
MRNAGNFIMNILQTGSKEWAKHSQNIHKQEIREIIFGPDSDESGHIVFFFFF